MYSRCTSMQLYCHYDTLPTPKRFKFSFQKEEIVAYIQSKTSRTIVQLQIIIVKWGKQLT